MKRTIQGAIAIAITFLIASPSYAIPTMNMVYQVNRTVDTIGSVTGDITTDGTMGALGTVNILDWNLTIDDGTFTAAVLTGPISGPNSTYSGSGISAVGNNLLFDFDNTAGVISLFQAGPSGQNYWCLSSTNAGNNCLAGADPSPPGESLRTYPGYPLGLAVSQTGNQIIASKVPEPGTLGILGLGLVGLGVARRKKVA